MRIHVTISIFLWISEPGCSDESESYEIPARAKKLPKAGKNKKAGEKPVRRLDTTKLRKETMCAQSSELESNLRKKMKIIKHGDGEETELEILVEKDLELRDLKKKLSSLTGISSKTLSLVVRGEPLVNYQENTKISEFWSAEDIVAIFPRESENGHQSKEMATIYHEG